MKNKIAIVTLASVLATPVLAAPTPDFKLSDFKTVAVQPVLAASNTRGLFESQLAAMAAGVEGKPERFAAIKKAAAVALEGQDAGFGFAGKAQDSDLTMLVLGDTLGMIPALLKAGAHENVKQAAQQLRLFVSKAGSKLAPQVVTALEMTLSAAESGHFQNTSKSLLLAMSLAADSIQPGSERLHGYLAVGIYAGFATVWAVGGQPSPAYAELASPLIALLEEDAIMGGADRQLAAQLRLIAKELVSETPDNAKVVAAIEAMNRVQAD